MSKAKTMSRSRNQLATSYAPGSFFTFEGGLGACLVRASPGESMTELSESTVDLIFERINEVGMAWFSAAMAAREQDPSKAQPVPLQCVDRMLLDGTQSSFRVPGRDRMRLCRPSSMEYTPAPLSFVCRTCGLFQDFESLDELDKALAQMSPSHCKNPKRKDICDWEQLDVIFVHWSGRWEQPFPGKYDWSQADGRVRKFRERCVCGGSLFRLNRNSSSIGEWFFECAACDKPLSAQWLQNDKDTLEILGSSISGERITEVRMQATPYRASNTYYVKSDLFIDFKSGSQQLLSCLRPGRSDDLKSFIASQFGFSTDLPSDEEILEACADRPECSALRSRYEQAIRSLPILEDMLPGLSGPAREAIQNSIDLAHDSKQAVITELLERHLLTPKIDLPAEVLLNLEQRQERFASKFDPLRLSVEHAALKTSRLDREQSIGGKRPYVSFVRLDDDLSPDDHSETEAQQSKTRGLLRRLGVADMGLIREFDLCKFSYGFSRMESSPVLREKRGMDMPVRLNLFPPVRSDDSYKNPIYVVQQSNEAIYVRLREAQVLSWLQSLDCSDMFLLNHGEKIGAGIIGAAKPMNAFLDGLSSSNDPPAYYYVYSLLHSYAHMLIKHVAEYSGLDLGSLGEYIFPADLAFVVYRNGTTMDLGNLSAMWRNSGNAMLSAMLSSKASQCGTGSLCTHRGGACPDCLMIPETSCIAGNKLLSRSVLNSTGGRPSRFDTRPSPIKGYFEFSEES